MEDKKILKTLQDLNLGIDVEEDGAQAYNYKYNNLKTILPYLASKKDDFKYSLRIRGTEVVSITEVKTETKKGFKQEYQVVLNVKWIMKFNDEPEEEIPMAGLGTHSDIDKATGIAITYSRRYLLINYFNLSDGGEYDPEQKDNYKVKQEPKKEIKMISEEQVKLIHKLKDDLALTDERYRELLKMGKSTDNTSKGLTHMGATKLIEFMKKEQTTKENF